jgi:hypothetical protein
LHQQLPSSFSSDQLFVGNGQCVPISSILHG